MKPEQQRGADTPAMTALQERQQREARALRANLLRRKQQQRSRPAPASGEGGEGPAVSSARPEPAR